MATIHFATDCIGRVSLCTDIWILPTGNKKLLSIRVKIYLTRILIKTWNVTICIPAVAKVPIQCSQYYARQDVRREWWFPNLNTMEENEYLQSTSSPIPTWYCCTPLRCRYSPKYQTILVTIIWSENIMHIAKWERDKTSKHTWILHHVNLEADWSVEKVREYV